MISVSCKVTNDRIAELCARIPDGVADAVGKAAFDIQKDAVKMAPYDTGTLAGSIQASVDETVGVVFTDVEYAGYQEFGTYKMAAHPFLRPAFDINAPKFVAAIQRMLASL